MGWILEEEIRQLLQVIQYSVNMNAEDKYELVRAKCVRPAEQLR